MSLLHQQSCECANEELDLFALPATQTSVQQGQWIEHHPLSNISDNGPIEFNISGTGEDYIDLLNTYLQIKAKIVKTDGSTIEEMSRVTPVNLTLHSLFSQVDVSLNEKLVTPSTNNYPYRAYIETLLSFGDAAKNSQFTSSLWCKDTAGKMEKVDTNLENLGGDHRRKRFAKSAVVDMMGRLHIDLFHQERYLLSRVDMKLRLVRSKDSFVLMAPTGETQTKVVITDASLFMRKLKLNPSVSLAHIKALEKSTAKYPVRRVELKVFSVPRGNLTANQENLFLGQLPKRIVVGCVDNDAYNGSFTKNPFNFQHYDINFISLYIDGQQMPSKPLQPTFEENSYVRCYHNLFSNLGKAGVDEGNQISYTDFGAGYTLFAFDITPDLDDGSSHRVQLIKNGNVRLEIHFANPLPNTINVIAYAEFDNLIEINKNRTVLFDYSA